MNKAKQKYFEKVYSEAKTIKCSCGCGMELKNKDRYGRDKHFVNGHNGRKYEDPTQYKREWNHRNRESRYKLKIERGHRLKREILTLLGGKCKKCNLSYDGKNGCVFQIHHLVPKNKKFIINTRTLNTYSRERILVEMKKCELLCANCHFINHNKEY